MNVLIVEDEPNTANLLKHIIENNSDFKVVEILDSIVDTVDYLFQHSSDLDLLFFDIQLVDGESFEIFKHVDITIPIIFCSAYDEYGLKAIKNNGIEYILKPFKEEDVKRGLNKYRSLVSRIKSIGISSYDNGDNFQQFFLCQFREKTIIVNVSDIAYFYVENGITYMYTFKNKRHILFKTLEYVESAIDPKFFFRINRQILINLKAIKSFESYYDRKISLNLNVDSKEVPIVSRLKVSRFKKWIQQ